MARLATLAAAGLCLVVPTIPGVGMLAGALTLPALAAASCYPTGRVFIQHFESGGTFLDFDADKVRAHYEQQFNATKAVWSGQKFIHTGGVLQEALS